MLTHQWEHAEREGPVRDSPLLGTQPTIGLHQRGQHHTDVLHHLGILHVGLHRLQQAAHPIQRVDCLKTAVCDT